jgi:hypothetical protein
VQFTVYDDFWHQDRRDGSMREKVKIFQDEIILENAIFEELMLYFMKSAKNTTFLS